MLNFISRRRFSQTFAIDKSKNYYEILGVTKNASNQNIRMAFFNLAKKYHPDLNSDKRDEDREQAKVMFQQINEAYSILTDNTKRNAYDREINPEPVKKPFDGDPDLDGPESTISSMF